MSKQNLDISSYTCTAAPTLPANNQTNETDRKTENIIRLGQKGNFSVDDISRMTYSGVLEEDLFSDTLTHASKMAMQDSLRHTPLNTSAFQSYSEWVEGVLQEHGIEVASHEQT